jgi:hypothetical protein
LQLQEFSQAKVQSGQDEKLQKLHFWSLDQSAQAKTCKTATVPLPNRRICCKVANLKPNACHPLTVSQPSTSDDMQYLTLSSCVH